MNAVISALLLLCTAVDALQTRRSVHMSFDLDRAVDTLSRNRILTKVSLLSWVSRLTPSLLDVTARSSFSTGEGRLLPLHRQASPCPRRRA